MRRLLVSLLVLVVVAIVVLGVTTYVQRTRRPPSAPAARPAQPGKGLEKGKGKAMVEPIVGTAANFGAEVLESPVPVVVDFWATWCGPCRMVSPILDELANEYQGKVKVVKVNVDEERELSGKYQIQAIPTIMFFKDGKMVDRVVGAESKASLARRFDKLSSGE